MQHVAWASSKPVTHPRSFVSGKIIQEQIHAKHDCFLGRIEIEPYDVTDLLDKHRIGTELETLDQMRL